MSAQRQDLINLQRQGIHKLRDDAIDLAKTLADEVWGKFEVEITKATADSFMFSLAASAQVALSGMLAMSYDDAFERHVLVLFERLECKLREATAGKVGFDSARVDLPGLRKSMKLRLYTDDLIGQAIERARPGLIGQLFLSTDPCSDAWDRDHCDNARRVRSNLLGLRGKIVEMIRNETNTLLQTAMLAYVNMLGALPRTVDTSQTCPEIV